MGVIHMFFFITLINNCGQAIHAYIVWWRNIHACCNEFEQVDDDFHLYIFYSCYIFLFLLNTLQGIIVHVKFILWVFLAIAFFFVQGLVAKVDYDHS
jgi:hypothetical protein